MKKTFKMMLAVAMLFTVTLSANAQFSSSGGDRVPDRFHMGIRGGLTSNSWTHYDPLLFPTGGIALDFQVAPVPIFLGIGMNYANLGFKYDSYGDTETVDAHSIHMPLTASYHINVAPNLFINPFAGPFFSYDLTDIEDEDDIDDSRFNYGFRVGCGMNFGRLTFDLGYDLGLKNFGNSDHSIKTGTLFMTVGFNWAGSR
jgi:hypothetical protein